MSEVYVIDLAIGGTMRVKVEAESEEAAQLVAAHYFIDDWENAGPLKIDDIAVVGIHEPPKDFLDASIIATGENSWEFANDDPYGRADE